MRNFCLQCSGFLNAGPAAQRQYNLGKVDITFHKTKTKDLITTRSIFEYQLTSFSDPVSNSSIGGMVYSNSPIQENSCDFRQFGLVGQARGGMTWNVYSPLFRKTKYYIGGGYLQYICSTIFQCNDKNSLIPVQ